MDYILAFGSAHRALKAESVLKKSSVVFRLLPAPKELVPYCDLVISVDEGSFPEASRVLEGARVRVKAVFRKEGDAYVKV